MNKIKSAASLNKKKESATIKKETHLAKHLSKEKAQSNRPIHGHTRPQN